MANHFLSDLKLVLKGAEQVAKAVCEHSASELRQSWHNSSVRTVAKKMTMDVEDVVSDAVANPQKAGLEAAKAVTETVQRLSMIPEGIMQFSVHAIQHARHQDAHIVDAPKTLPMDSLQDETHLGHTSSTIPEVSAAYAKHGRSISVAAGAVLEIPTEYSQHVGSADTVPSPATRGVAPSTVDRPVEPVEPSVTMEQKLDGRLIQQQTIYSANTPVKPHPVTSSHKPMLTEHSKASKVPASRVGRLISYGGLAAGLGLGALAEVTRRTLGMTDSKTDIGSAVLSAENPFLTQANISRIVDTLCKVRGAALKIGQILSIQGGCFTSALPNCHSDTVQFYHCVNPFIRRLIL